jgi:hypothetical protein
VGRLFASTLWGHNALRLVPGFPQAAFESPETIALLDLKG